MKLSTTIVLLSIASCTYAQSVDKDSRSTKIDETEKKRIENQYKTLNNFYIDDDGLVVYQTQSNPVYKSVEEAPADTVSNAGSFSSKNAQAGNYISEKKWSTKEDSSESTSGSTERPLSTRIISTTAESSESSYVASNDKSPVRPTIIRKEATRPTEASLDNENARASEEGKEATRKSRTVVNSPITIEEDEVADNLLEKNKKAAVDKKVTSKTAPKKTSVFEKKSYTSQYKTMEEAALAVEALLDDLRKEQGATTSAGSMSSRLSGGAGRAVLRKKPASNPSYSATNSSLGSITSKAVEQIDQSTSEFGYEPSYFINGKEVDKVEVNRLRKKEIINKEVRTRNTVSGNPNGEVWYEVKYDN